MPGSLVGDGCILASTPVPPGTIIRAAFVLVGRPPHVIRWATMLTVRLAALRQHQTNLTDYPAPSCPGPYEPAENGNAER